MKKLLGLATVAALVAGIQTAQAVPTLRLEITSTVANTGCAAFMNVSGPAGTNIANGCAWQGTGGLLWEIAPVNFANWAGSVTLKGSPVQDMPAFWLDAALTGFATTNATIKAFVWDYDQPLNPAALSSFLGFSLEAGNTGAASFYFDGDNGLDASATGDLIASITADSTFVNPVITPFDGVHGGLYSMAYVLSLTTASGGQGFTSSFDGKVTTQVPTPAAAALLGLGLLGAGLIRRRAK